MMDKNLKQPAGLTGRTPAEGQVDSQGILEVDLTQIPSRGIPLISGDGSIGIMVGTPLPGAELMQSAHGLCLEKLMDALPPDQVLGITLIPGGEEPGEDVLELLAAWVEKGLALVHWQCRDIPPASFQRFLWKIARLGIWNHFSLTGLLSPGEQTDTATAAWTGFAMENPYIIHSYGDGENGARGQVARYGDTRPLPGIPLWQTLDGCRGILAALAGKEGRKSAKALAALRWDEDMKRATPLGTDMVFAFQSPGDLPEGYLEEICRMVAAGGSVDITHVKANLKRAHKIAYALENGVIVGNSSLKHPRPEFFDYLRRVTGLDFTGFVERGYTSVRPEYRAFGVGKKLLEGLTSRAGEFKVFSLISEDNLATQKIALRNRTRKLLTYTSERSGKAMGLWMPESMVPTMDDQWQEALHTFNRGEFQPGIPGGDREGGGE
ncbi:MAG: hypothetical protein MI747_09335 [Desulfobacterales bacterium]|nr:hypothetical protein [Desulfobacterales bacterium]